MKKSILLLLFLTLNYLSEAKEVWKTLYIFPSTITFTDIAAYDSLNIIAIGENKLNSIKRSTDGGLNWKTARNDTALMIPDADTMAILLLKSISTPSSNLWLIGCDKSKILRVSESGTVWTKITLPSKFKDDKVIKWIEMINDKIGFCHTGKTIFKTNDGGISWEGVLMDKFNNSTITNINVIDSNTLIINTFKDLSYNSYITENSLKSIKELTELYSNRSFAKFSKINRDTSFAIVTRFDTQSVQMYVYKTTNCWQNHQIVHIDTIFTTFNSVFTDITMLDSNIGFLNMSAIPYHTFDGFKTLFMDSVASKPLDQQIMKTILISKNRLIMLLSKSKICFYDLKYNDVNDNCINLKNHNNLQLYPNPFKNNIPLNIQFEGNQEYKELNINIININGELIDSNIIFGGDFLIQYLPDSSLPSGTYFIVISSNGEVLGREKFVVVE